MLGGKGEGHGAAWQQNGLKQAGQGHGFAEAQARFLFDTALHLPPAGK